MIGIDPGITGAVAYLDGDRAEVWDMPAVAKVVASSDLASLLLSVGAKDAVLERAQSMPKQGVASSFGYGVTYGQILGVLGALHISTRLVRPAQWKQRAGLIGKGKEDSRELAIRLWPSLADKLARKKDHGRAEALLIARFGTEQNGG